MNHIVPRIAHGYTDPAVLGTGNIMVTLNEEMTIASPAGAIWPLLSDPAVVAGCIPGAELSADSDDEVWRGSIRVKFGPTVAMFKGEATLEFDDASRRVTLDGRGIDGRGASRALANMVVELHPDEAQADSSKLKVEGGFTVTGPLETFVNAGGVHVARALLGEFCTNIAAAVMQSNDAPASVEAVAAQNEDDEPTITRAERNTSLDGAPKSTVQPPTQTVATSSPTLASRPAELSASSLLWRALVGWFKSLFGKGKKP